LKGSRSSIKFTCRFDGRRYYREAMDEQIVTQVEGSVSAEVSTKLEAQQVFTHTKSPNYAIVVDVSLTTPFIATTTIVVTS
jgi:translation initiation factor IF-3